MNDDVQAVILTEMMHATAEDGSPTTEFLLSIRKHGNDKYSIEVINQQTHSLRKHNIYLIVRSLKAADGRNQRGYILRAGDVIKLGRIEYRVAEMLTKRLEHDTSGLNISD